MLAASADASGRTLVGALNRRSAEFYLLPDHPRKDPARLAFIESLRKMFAVDVTQQAINPADDMIMRVLDRGAARTSEIAAELGKSIRWTRQRLNALVDAGHVVELSEGPNDPRRRYAPAARPKVR